MCKLLSKEYFKAQTSLLKHEVCFVLGQIGCGKWDLSCLLEMVVWGRGGAGGAEIAETLEYGNGVEYEVMQSGGQIKWVTLVTLCQPSHQDPDKFHYCSLEWLLLWG